MTTVLTAVQLSSMGIVYLKNLKICLKESNLIDDVFLSVHAVHDISGENHGKSNPGVADPKDLQTNPAHVAGPSV